MGMGTNMVGTTMTTMTTKTGVDGGWVGGVQSGVWVVVSKLFLPTGLPPTSSASWPSMRARRRRPGRGEPRDSGFEGEDGMY
jgi:hypothetical protein